MPRSPTSRRRVLQCGVAVLGAALAGCTDGTTTDDQPDGPDDETGPDDAGPGNGGMGTAHDVAATVVVGPDGRNVYRPEEVRIAAGSTVRWVWDSGPHTLTPQQVPEGSDWRGDPTRHGEGFRVDYTFPIVGSYQYQCAVHDDMVGVLHVQ